MSKFKKESFIKFISDKIQDAIDTGLISHRDVIEDDLVRLSGFIQYELSKSINDRTIALEVLKELNYDERQWVKLQEELGGNFESLIDIALANAWKYIQLEGLINYNNFK